MSNGYGLSGRIRIYKKTDSSFRYQTDSILDYPVPFDTKPDTYPIYSVETDNQTDFYGRI